MNWSLIWVWRTLPPTKIVPSKSPIFRVRWYLSLTRWIQALSPSYTRAHACRRAQVNTRTRTADVGQREDAQLRSEHSNDRNLNDNTPPTLPLPFHHTHRHSPVSKPTLSCLTSNWTILHMSTTYEDVLAIVIITYAITAIIVIFFAELCCE